MIVGVLKKGVWQRIKKGCSILHWNDERKNFIGPTFNLNLEIQAGVWQTDC